MKATDDEDARYLRGLTVLYVEDDDETRAQLAEILARRVRRVLSASDGAAGLADFRAFRPDLVITDVQMPPMDGLTMARLIREIDAHVPIVVTTAFDQASYLTRAIELGVEAYVMKPIEASRLSAALLTVARRLRLEAEARRRAALEADLSRARALAALAGGMAHDYNNLLQRVLGAVSFARDVLDPASPAAPLLEEAEVAAGEASALGAILVRLSHRGPAPPASAPLEAALGGALRAACAGRGVEVDLAVAGAPAVSIEAAELALVARQIADNACDAMPAGGVLHVEAELLDDPSSPVLPVGPGRYVRVSFRDEGHGLSPEVLARMFDPYFSTKGRGPQRGVGLGLSLARSVVEQWGGAIVARPAPDRGAVVEVLLPVANDPPSGPPGSGELY